MSTVAILGSGFGLYGYLPAMAGSCGHRVVLPERYRPKLALRPELAGFVGSVRWVSDERAALANADTVVLALQPAQQARWIPECLAAGNLERLLLEKPLAPSPGAALSLFEDLVRSRRVFRIGYIFRFTPWGESLFPCRDDAFRNSGLGRVRIEWRFFAHHFRLRSASWKRFCSSGGGAIRFYGIQLIALLAERGYERVVSSQSSGPSPEEIVRWVATFSGNELPDCDVVVDTKDAITGFRVVRAVDGTATTVVAQADPFGSEERAASPGSSDGRVPLLARLCRSLWGDSEDVYGRYRDTLALWRAVEDRTSFERCSA
jgi:hypothetical protein